MMVKVLPVLALVCLVLYASFCSAQVPKIFPWQTPSVNMSNHVDQSQLTQPGVTQREGKLLQKSHPGINQSQQQIHRVSESLQLCEVDESSRVGCGEPGISPVECEALECCYDNWRFIQAYHGPMCYYGKVGEKWKLNCFLISVCFDFLNLLSNLLNK